MNRKLLYLLLGILAVVLIWLAAAGGEDEEQSLYAEAERGKFDITVTTTGELQARHSEKIRGPNGLRKAGIYQVKITDIRPEGDYVQEGDYIATLDKTEAATKLNDIHSELDKIKSQYTTTRLDTALTLRAARDELINLRYTQEEQRLVVQQSKFEPPAVIRKAEIELEKAERALVQAEQNYIIKKEQAVAKMQEVNATLTQQQRKLNNMESLLDEFIIKAPKPGMLIYHKTWEGQKLVAGGTISAWSPVVATLPDLSVMISKTYVNEVDISKVKKDQKVAVSIDAFPDNAYTGVIISVANVGEQLPGADAKVFEVQVQVNEQDSILRPSMTSTNNILIESYKDVLFVPIECVHSTDSLSYVFMDSGLGLVKQEVIPGRSNENHIIIEKGLTERQKIYLSRPEKANELELKRL